MRPSLRLLRARGHRSSKFLGWKCQLLELSPNVVGIRSRGLRGSISANSGFQAVGRLLRILRFLKKLQSDDGSGGVVFQIFLDEMLTGPHAKEVSDVSRVYLVHLGRIHR